jgi:curved DNA-binding protein
MDYYKILEVDKNASDEDIKKSYRKLAMKYHPDRNKGNKESEEKFKLITEAYRTLSDPQAKREYDNQISGKVNAHFYSKGNNFDDYFSSDLNEIFNTMFSRQNMFDDGWGHREQSFASNSRSRYKVSISFWESVLGASKNFTVLNRFKQKEDFTIKIPAGIEDGTTIQVQLSNEIILIDINVKQDPYFERKGLDLYTEIELNLGLALLGGKINLPHWNTTYEVNIPENVQQGQLLRLTGAGIKQGLNIGNLYLKCKIVSPKKLTKKQKEIIAEFKKTEKDKPALSEKKQTWKK